jgi:nucleoside-diphosphate-sugar epimerase
MEQSRPTILVTGAAGHVARLIMPALRKHYRLRRLDVADQEPAGDDELVRGDVADVGVVERACAGVVAVVHLAAKAFEDDFLSVLLPRNVIGGWSVFEAARRAGVPAVVYASTGQTLGGNPPGVRITPELPARPISVYACTKLFGEALGRYYSDQHGLRVAALRLGLVDAPDGPLVANEADAADIWCSPDDLARLVLAVLTSDVPFATVIVVSGPAARQRFDTANPYGWVPRESLTPPGPGPGRPPGAAGPS